MAFFKFRFPGNASEAASEGLSATSGESMEVLRRRARHRLFGSVVLVLTAVVAFPLLFDSQPRPVAVDTPIVIPDRNSSTSLTAGATVPAAQAPAKPLLPASTEAAVSAHASLEPGKEEVVAPDATAKGGLSRAEVPAASAPVAKSEPKAEPKHEPKPEPKPAAKPEPKAEHKTEPKTSTDSQKAKALLEGKAPTDAAKVIVQVGAFSDAEKLREVRRKLEGAGLKTYTQTVEKDGKKTTRVRVGPFDSRAEADKAAVRIRKLDLPAHLITL